MYLMIIEIFLFYRLSIIVVAYFLWAGVALDSKLKIFKKTICRASKERVFVTISPFPLYLLNVFNIK